MKRLILLVTVLVLSMTSCSKEDVQTQNTDNISSVSEKIQYGKPPEELESLCDDAVQAGILETGEEYYSDICKCNMVSATPTQGTSAVVSCSVKCDSGNIYTIYYNTVTETVVGWELNP